MLLGTSYYPIQTIPAFKTGLDPLKVTHIIFHHFSDLSGYL